MAGPVELALAAALLLGLYVRAAALGALLLTILGLSLFGTAMLAYAGALAGAALYLVLRGGGPLCCPAPPAAAEPVPASSVSRASGRCSW